MSSFDQLIGGFSVALSWKGLLYCFIGCLWGTIVGVLPGLGPLAGMTLLLPLTFGLDPTIGIIMLTGIFYGAMYGGSTTSILVRIPGEAASVVTCIDGYEMARRGRAGPALMIAAPAMSARRRVLEVGGIDGKVCSERSRCRCVAGASHAGQRAEILLLSAGRKLLWRLN
jgi:TctA family transporter